MKSLHVILFSSTYASMQVCNERRQRAGRFCVQCQHHTVQQATRSVASKVRTPETDFQNFALGQNVGNT